MEVPWENQAFDLIVALHIIVELIDRSAGYRINQDFMILIEVLIEFINGFRPNIEKKPSRNNSAFYLKKAKEKEQEVERLLQLTISRVKKTYENRTFSLIFRGKTNMNMNV